MSDRAINFTLLKQIYHGLARIYIESIKYHSYNDVKELLNNSNFKSRTQYREQVFNLCGEYFENTYAKKVYKDIIRYCYEQKIENPDKDIKKTIHEWKLKNLRDFINSAPKQILDEKYTLMKRIKYFFKNKKSSN